MGHVTLHATLQLLMRIDIMLIQTDGYDVFLSASSAPH